MVRHRTRLVLAALLVTGGWSACLLDTGTINKRPHVQISDTGPLHRGETVTFSATITDANDKLDALTLEWRMGETCELDAAQPLTCGGEKKNECRYTVPSDTKSNSLCLMVRVSDPYSASDSATRSLSIQNRAPVAKIALTSPLSRLSRYPLQTSFTFSGEASEDADPGDKDRLLYHWTVTLNDQPLDAAGCSDASKPKLCSFTADEPGKYRVSLKVEDPSQTASEPESALLEVDKDGPPCINTSSAGPGIYPQLLTPTMFAAQSNYFEVTSVSDDVNPYLPNPDKPNSTPGTFKWSMRTGTSNVFNRCPSVTSNRFTVPANAFHVGDQVQFRVEYQDRQGSLATCSPELTCCALDHECCLGNGECTCAQWITWTVMFQ